MIIGLFGGGRLGVVDGDQVIDVSEFGGPVAGPEGRLAQAIRDGVGKIEAYALDAYPRTPIADVEWEAPLPRPGKIIGAPANYFEHVDEMPDSATILEWGVFLKAGTSVIGPGATVQIPYRDLPTHYEGELAVVIGKGGKNISLESALDHVYGYTCVLDITVRSTEDRSTRKSFDTFTPLGPWIVSADEVGDASDLDLRLTVNGEERQHTSTSRMIYGIPELIAYTSSVMRLEPGDVIATGTPSGVGPIADGDRIELVIERVGTLQVSVSDEGAIDHAERPGPRTALRRQ